MENTFNKEEFLEEEKEIQKELLENILRMGLLVNRFDDDTYHLYKLIGLHNTLKLVKFFDSGYIQIPSYENFHKVLQAIYSIYLLETNEFLTWEDIKNILGISNITQIKKTAKEIKKRINTEYFYVFKKIYPNNDLKNIIKLIDKDVLTGDGDGI